MASKPDGSIFKHAESLRSSLTKEQQKRIKKLYEDWAKDIEERAAKLAKKTNPSATLSNAQANILKRQIEATGKQVANGVYTEVKTGMLEVSEAVLGDAGKFMKGLGFPEDGISAAFSNVSAGIVNSLVTGSVYGKPGSWSLSKSIWSDNEGTMQKAYEIVAKGIAENLPVQDIAGMLKDFVSPDRRVPWVGPKGSRIYTKKVDYNAQRLARTLSQHTYQQSMVAAVEDNPFIDSFRWVSNGSRACDLCKERDGKIFKKDEVPLDHPNGMCVMEPVADVDAMATRLADWVKGKDDPEVDKFAKHFGYEKPKGMSLDDIKKKYTQGIDSKIPSKWYKGLPKDVQEEVTRIHQASGMKWKDWYQKHIMKGGAGSVDDVAKKATAAAKKQASPSKAETVAQKVAEPVRQQVVDGKNIITTWKRREDKFDFAIEDTMDAQGFDGLPRIVDAAEFDETVKKSKFIAQRSYSAPTQEVLDSYRDMLYNGKWYVDCSTGGAQYGQGMYCAANWEGKLTDGIKAEMKHYSDLNVERSREVAWLDKIRETELDDMNSRMQSLSGKQFTEDEWRVFKTLKQDVNKTSRDLPESDREIWQGIVKAKKHISANNVLSRMQQEFNSEYKGFTYVETLTLDPSAKVITYNDLLKEYENRKQDFAEMFDPFAKEELSELGITGKEANDAIKYLRASLGLGGVSDNAASNAYARLTQNGIAAANKLYSLMKDKVSDNMDIGAYAVLKGYDAINAEGHGDSGSYTVILNRTKLIIKRPE